MKRRVNDIIRNLILISRFIFICITLICCSRPQSNNNITVDNKSYIPIDKSNENTCIATEVHEIKESTCALHMYSQIVSPGFLDSFSKLNNLKEVRISHCVIESLEHFLMEISEHCNLIKLSFYDCSISRIPNEIKEFKNLKYIKIHQYTTIQTISNELFKLDQLEIVSLSFVKNGNSLMKFFCRIDSLKELELRWCNINKIEKCILNHNKLIKLSLQGNNIDSIDLVGVYNPLIKEINIVNNPMSDRIFKNQKKFNLSLEKSMIDKHLPLCNLLYYEILDFE